MIIKEVGVKLTIKGGEFYRHELQEINREIRLLQIQSKLAAAQLGNNAKSTNIFQTRVSGLSKEIQFTSEKVDSYKKRYTFLETIAAQDLKNLKSIVKEVMKHQPSNQKSLQTTSQNDTTVSIENLET